MLQLMKALSIQWPEVENFGKKIVDRIVKLTDGVRTFSATRRGRIAADQAPENQSTMGRTSDAKEKLLDVAFQMIWNNSYGGVSLDQICERAKVNKGSFHYYFGTKADLAVAAYEEHWKQKQPELDRLFSAQIPPLERLAKWCDWVYRSQKEKCEKYGHVCGCAYSSIGSELATQDDKVRLKVEELITRGMKYIESALADAMREGAVSITDPKAAAQQVYSYVMGTVLQAKIRNDVEVLRNIEPTVMAIIRAKETVTA
jgi:TetR/AcrR family transcriptional repressor of nem operon